MGPQEFTRAQCVGPIKLVNLQPLHDDIRRFKTALERHGNGVRAFMNSASPGLITAFQGNAYYPTHEAYLGDLVTAMQPEYEAIVAAGLDLQLDCPDLAMSRHTGYQDMSEAEFLKAIEANVEALNAATANIAPEKMRMHVCWGNYEGPHDCDIPLERIIDIVLKARPATVLFEAANPRHEHEWIVWRDAGDVAKRDADGYVYITDRKKDMVVSGGFNVFTAEVEAAITELEAVRECAVIGILHDKWGEQVHAIVAHTKRRGSAASRHRNRSSL
jgi:AMP-binding enzyme C-terminal domain